MYVLKVSVDIIKQVLENGIYYFNKFGEVHYLSSPKVDCDSIIGRKYGKECYFKWENLNKKFWLIEEEAKTEAQKYLDEILRYINLKRLKKICNLKVNDSIYYKEGKNIFDTTIENSFSNFHKDILAFVNIIEYDDDYGSKYDEKEFPISEYGKTWALTEGELI